MTDSSGGGSRFDPRFDPAFQPGYDPKADGRPKARELHAHELLGDESGVPDVGALLPSKASADIRDVDRTELAARARRVDPFLIAIWLLSALFIAAGLYLLRYMAERLNDLNATGGGSSADYYLLNSYATGAPLLVVLGLATATGSLFLLAARRGRRPTG